MASAYPGALDNFPTTRVDETPMATTHAADHDNANDAINKIEAELGVNPSGALATVVARLNAVDTSISNLEAAPSLNTQTGTSYTLVAADANKIVGMNNASANTVTVPRNAVTAFPIGTTIVLRQVGAGQTTVQGDGTSVIHSRGNFLKLAGQYAYATLIKVATDTWELSGDVTS